MYVRVSRVSSHQTDMSTLIAVQHTHDSILIVSSFLPMIALQYYKFRVYVETGGKRQNQNNQLLLIYYRNRGVNLYH